MEDKNIHLLQYALNIKQEVDVSSLKLWDEFYLFCQCHSVLGIGFMAIEKWCGEIKPSKELLYQWLVDVSSIEDRNRILNFDCLKLQSFFRVSGFKTCILKGQGNALLYSNPLRRQSGDIDIWVLPQNARFDNTKVRSVIEFLRAKCKLEEDMIGYHHTKLHGFGDVEIEVHYRPTWFCSPLRNYRLQKWFEENSENQLKNNVASINVPDLAFNTVYQLAHIFNHFVQEGIGLRQVIDYYFVLQAREKENIISLLNYLGLARFAGAMMYVMQVVFLLSEDKLLCRPNKEDGEFILNEILNSGNFGLYDYRNAELLQQKGIKRKLYQMRRSWRYFKYFPEETLCYSFRVYHVIWRKLQLWRWE